MYSGNQFGVEFSRDKPGIYNNVVHALRHLLLSNFEKDKRAKIVNSSHRVLITKDGLTYYFVEVRAPEGTTYLLEAYGTDALELYAEATNIKNYGNVKE
ncbi:MAG TPA: hypothetical protein VH415_14680 [Nitrososphaeraceae archaeon]|jgi:hypothetical protein